MWMIMSPPLFLSFLFLFCSYFHAIMLEVLCSYKPTEILFGIEQVWTHTQYVSVFNEANTNQYYLWSSKLKKGKGLEWKLERMDIREHSVLLREKFMRTFSNSAPSGSWCSSGTHCITVRGHVQLLSFLRWGHSHSFSQNPCARGTEKKTQSCLQVTPDWTAETDTQTDNYTNTHYA